MDRSISQVDIQSDREQTEKNKQKLHGTPVQAMIDNIKNLGRREPSTSDTPQLFDQK